MLVLGIFRGKLVQNYIECSLWLALGNLFGVISDPQLMSASAGPGCMWKGQSCTPRPVFTSTRPGVESQSLKSIQRSPLPAGCLLDLVLERSSSCTPQQGLNSTVGVRGIPFSGATASPRLMLNGGECSDSMWLLLSVLAHKASLQLVFSLLFRMIFL